MCSVESGIGLVDLNSWPSEHQMSGLLKSILQFELQFQFFKTWMAVLWTNILCLTHPYINFSVYISVKDINSIWPLSHTSKVLQRLQNGREKHFSLQREDILSEVLGHSLWGNPVAMRQIVFSRHLTWISALPPYRSGPPRPLYSLVSTSDSRGGGPSKLFLQMREEG